MKLVDIDHPTPEAKAPVHEPSPEQAKPASPTVTSIYSMSGAINDGEFYSPAFMKRARTSYGSLFDSDYDPFAEEDGSIKGKGRKRTRLSSTWRYESRSPTPEVEETDEQSARHASPEPTSAPAATVTSEATQTIESALEDAAESLAELSRQGTNGDTSLNGAFISENHTSELAKKENLRITDNMMVPARIQMQAGLTVKLPASESQYPKIFVPPAPESHRLQPLSSDKPPLVAPLVTSKLTTGESIFEADIDDVPQDLYGVSPVSPHNEHQSPVVGFGDSAVGLNSLIEVNEGQPRLENQYAHRQTATKQLSQVASPPQHQNAHEEERNMFDVERDRTNPFDHNISNLEHDGPLSSIEQPQHRYPEPGDDLHIPSFGTGWVHQGSTNVTYPDLQDPDDMRSASRSPPRSQPAFFSRGGSAQSEIVDPIVIEGEEENFVQEDLVDEESDGSEQDSAIEERYGRESPNKSAYFQQRIGEEIEYDEVSEASEEEDQFEEQLEEQFEEEFEEEQSEEDQFEENGQYGIHQDDAFDDYEEEDEEADYVEDMEGQRVLAEKGPPVFIDLLSSDDEDAGEQPAPAPTARAIQLVQQPEYSEEEESEDAEDGEEDIDLASAERSELASSPLKQSSRESNEEGNAASPRSKGERDPIHSLEQSKHEDILDALDEGKADSEDLEHKETDQEDLASQASSPQEHLHREDNVVEVRDGSPRDGEYDFVSSREMDNGDPSLESSKARRHNHKSPPDPSFVYSGGFGLDGAGDSLIQVLNPALPRQESTVTSSGFGQATQSTSASKTYSVHKSSQQLPTPADSQFSRKIASQVSFSFTTGIQASETTSQRSLDHIPIDPALTADVDEVAKIETTGPSGDRVPLGEETEMDQVIVEPNGKIDIVNEESVNSSNEVDGGMSAEKPKFEAADAGHTSIVEDQPALEVADSSAARIVVDKDTSMGKSPEEAEEQAPMEKADLRAPSVDRHLVTLEETIQTSPRRSRRVGKASSIVDPMEAVLPSTPGSDRRKVTPAASGADASSPVTSNDQTNPAEHDASLEMALSALSSPTKQYDLRDKHPSVDLRLRLTRILRTELSEFSALKILRYHIKEKLDVLAVATTTAALPERVKGGPRHFQITFNTTDPSIASSASCVTEVHILRPYKDALPIVHAGDSILLRNFQVISLKDKGFGLRSEQGEASSWAVFKDGEDDAEVRGPPVEYGDGEKRYANSLKEWYRNLDSAAIAKLKRADAKVKHA